MAAKEPGHWMLSLAAARAAINRHADETMRESLDIYRGYATAGESLLWLAILEESLWPPKGTEERRSYEERRHRDGRGRVAQGLRFLRNRIVHEQVVRLVEQTRVEGFMIPMRVPWRSDSCVFRWRGGLEPFAPRKGGPDRYASEEFEAYQDHLADRPTHHTLEPGLLWVELEIERRGLLPRGTEWLAQTMGVDPIP